MSHVWSDDCLCQKIGSQVWGKPNPFCPLHGCLNQRTTNGSALLPSETELKAWALPVVDRK